MCDECANTHSRRSLGHQVVNLREHSLRYCDQHKGEKIKMYCLRCETAVCTRCFIIEHNGHKYSDIREAFDDLKEQLRINMKRTTELFNEVNKQSCNLDKIFKTFVRNISQIEGQIVRRGNEIKTTCR